MTIGSISSASKTNRSAPGGFRDRHGVGQPHDDAVVGGGRLLVDAVALAQPAADRQRQRPVHPQPIGRVQDHPPVAELVAEPLDQQAWCRWAPCRWPCADRRAAATGCRWRSRRNPLRAQRSSKSSRSRPASSPVNAPIAAPSSAGRPTPSPRQNGSRAGCPGRGDHQHPVVGDLGDPPTGGTQRDDVAGPRLVDHLLVEFAYPRGLFGVRTGGQVDGEQAAVGDRAAGGDGQPLRTRAARSACRRRGRRPAAGAARRTRWTGTCRDSRSSVASKALRGSVANGALRRTVSNQTSASSGSSAHAATVCWASTSSGLAGTRMVSIWPASIRCTRDRAADQVGAVLGEQHAAGDLADLMAGPADALQPAGHRRRRLDLDHQVDRAHVDAEFQAGGGDDRLEPPALEVVLDRRRAAPC